MPFDGDAAPAAPTAPAPSPSAPAPQRAAVPVHPGPLSTSPDKRPGMSALDLTGAKISQHLSEGAANSQQVVSGGPSIPGHLDSLTEQFRLRLGPVGELQASL